MPYLDRCPTHYGFMAELSTFIQLLTSGAHAILTLEGQTMTCGDVFYAWVCIAWHLEKLMADPKCGLLQLRNTIQEVYNHRFDQMMQESSFNIFLLGYWLHPCMYSPISSH